VQTQDEVLVAIASVAKGLPGGRPRHLPDFENRDAGYPFVRIEGDVFVYLAHERGRETFRRESTDLDDLLWFVFHDVTREMARARGFARLRAPGKDSRRSWFPRWVDLMTGLRPEWGARTQAHVDAVLAQSPYRDR